MKMFRLLGSLIGAAFFAFPIIWLAGLLRRWLGMMDSAYIEGEHREIKEMIG